MGPQDLVYPILVLASIKTGYKLLLSSPRNTVEAHLSLLEKTDCATFLLPPNFPLPAVKQITAARTMRVLDIPGTQHWLQDGAVDHYPYEKKFEDARLEPFVVLHTSGSTGMPKPIVQAHGTMSPLDAYTALPSLGHEDTYPAVCKGKRVYLAFPLFHCAGVSMILPGCLYAGYTVVLGPFPPSADVANAVHVFGNVQHSCLAPVTLVDLVKDPQHLENLGRLEQVTFGGGPLPKAVGDLITSKTKLLNCLGTTECGVLPLSLCDPEDWDYMKVSPVIGHEYRHVSEDLYEQVIVRKSELEPYQGIFATFPDLTEWPMKDLYSKHPSKDIWLYRGRADDIIVFSTGEKINPLEMEGVIAANPAVSAALIAGFGRFQSSLIIEPVTPPTNASEKEALLDAIWPSVEAANRMCPSHGRIHRNMILFTSVDKPMPRAGKGTVQRKPTVDLYSSELDSLYRENETHPSGGNSDAVENSGDVPDIIKRIVTASTDIGLAELGDSTDLFELGLDSLQVTSITKRLNRYVETKGRKPLVEARMVYANPSISAIAAIVEAILDNKSPTHALETDEEKMKNLYDRHASNLPITARPALPKPSKNFVVLITGSTGNLGSYILDSLLANPQVSSIYCLTRGTETAKRQEESLAARGLRALSDKAKCLDADLRKPYFGLTIPPYRELLSEVTTVIHNAWQVDFNMTLSSFSSQIDIVSQLINFSAGSKFGAQIFFISSISAVANWKSVTGKTEDIPEGIFDDWRVPNAMGYGQSKFVAERLLDNAIKEIGIPAVVCRVGQIAGPTMEGGMWPKQEWFPSLVNSSKYLGLVPESLGALDTVDWIPVDVLGQAIVELAIKSNSQEKTGATVYHTVSPHKTSWKDLLPTVARCIKTEGALKTVPLKEWVTALRKSASDDIDVGENPAIKLLGFFEDLAREGADSSALLDSKTTAMTSKVLAGLGPLKEEWVENWMRQWAF
jgi:thioester reductase-like protein